MISSTATYAADHSQDTRKRIDSMVAAHFPGFKPCTHWEQESAGLRRVYSDKPGIDLFKNARYIAVTMDNSGYVTLKDGLKTYALGKI